MLTSWGELELAALGQIVLSFSELEWCAERLLAGFLNDDTVATLLVTGEPMTWKLDKLSVISQESLADPDARKALSDWVKASRILNDRRNQIIHSLFVLVDTSEAMTRLKASTRGGNWRAQSEPIDLPSLQEVADLLRQGCEAAAEMLRHGAWA